VLGDVADRLLGDPEDQLGPVVAQLDAVGHLEPDLDAPAGEGVEQVTQGGRQAGAVQARRVDLDQQRPQRPDPPAQGLGAAVEGVGLLPVALGGRLGLGPDQRVVGRGQVLDDPVVQVAGDPVEQQQRPQGDGQELAPHGPGVGRHRAVPGVGLEQQGVAARCRDRQVDLEQAALVALEPVLGAVRSLSSASTLLSRRTACSSMARGSWPR
jgi:hypothetical protein